MLDILSDYLNDAATHEMKTLIEAANDVFDKIGLRNYEDTYTAILMCDDSVAQGDTVTSIINTTIGFQKRILLAHGVCFVPETGMAILTATIEGLLAIQNYDNSIQLIRTAELDGPEEEVFAELMSLVCEYSVDDILPLLETVRRSIITRIKEMALIAEAHAVISPESNNKYISNFKKFCTLISSQPPRITELLTNGMDTGSLFEMYVSIIDRDFESMPEDLAAKELIAMAIISSDGENNPRAIIAKNIEQFISDIDVITRVTIIINDLLLRLK